MRTYAILAGCLLISALSTNIALSQSESLTLEQCYRLTLARSESLQIREQDFLYAEARYQEALATLYPNFTLNSRERFRNSGGGGVTSSNDSNSDNDFSGTRTDRFESSLRVTQPIFSGFRNLFLKSAAESDSRAAALERDRAGQLLYSDVATLFYQIAAYQRELGELEAMQKILKQRSAELTEWQKLGKSRESELFAAKAELADLSSSFEQILGIKTVSVELMAFLTGVDSNILTLKTDLTVPTLLDLNHYLERAKLRPDYSATEERRSSFEKQLLAVKRERWPNIGLEGNYYLKHSPDNSRDWDVAFNLNMPVFDSGRITAKSAQMQTFLRSSELRRQETARVIERDVRSDFAQVQSIQREIVRLKEFVALSNKNYESQQKDYELGVVTNLDVLAALRQYREARRRLIGAESRLAVSISSLLVAAGEVP